MMKAGANVKFIDNCCVYVFKEYIKLRGVYEEYEDSEVRKESMMNFILEQMILFSSFL